MDVNLKNTLLLDTELYNYLYQFVNGEGGMPDNGQKSPKNTFSR